jgi:hypothetical protein
MARLRFKKNLLRKKEFEWKLQDQMAQTQREQ